MGQNPLGTLFFVLGFTNIIFLVTCHAVGSASPGGGVTLSESRDVALWRCWGILSVHRREGEKFCRVVHIHVYLTKLDSLGVESFRIKGL